MKQYHDVLRHIFENGEDRKDRTGVGARAVFGVSMRFNLGDGFPAITTKKLAFESVKAELLWFVKGSGNVKELNALGSRIWDANAEAPYWKSHAKFEGDVGRIYGVQWRKWKSPYGGPPIDQLKNAMEKIKTDPASRRIIVSAWNPAELDMMALPPCHVLFQFFVSGKKLSLQMYQRSGDMFLGVPFNIASYSLLLSMISQVTGLVPGEFVHIIGDAHIYHNHFDQVKEQLSRNPFPLPQLWLNPEIGDIDMFTMDDIKLVDYEHHPPIKAIMAV